jgi:hypothetical protein
MEEAFMKVEVHAPSTLVLVVSLALAVLALLCFFVVPGTPGFWMAIMAYCVMAMGTMVKT